MSGEFGTGKTVLILAIVAGCFAVLWPKLFYPMLQASMNSRNSADSSQACCDVIFENDVNAIKIMNEMCGNILHRYDDFDPKLTQSFHEGKLTKEVVATCRKEVLDICGVDITAFLNERVRLGKTYKQILDDIRSFNSSVCLKQNFGVDPGLLGAPHRMRIGALHMPSHHRQERPPHLRPDFLHPALQERGRAIPQSHVIPKVIEKEGKPPGPIPGMRPPMGGAGHVVPAPKGGGTMGIIMPIYTIGIVVFFMYTIMKMLFKKTDTTGQCEDFSPDPEFRKMVFAEEYYASKKPQVVEGKQCQNTAKRESSPPFTKNVEENATKLVVTAITGLLAEVDLQREILAKQAEEQINTCKPEHKLEDEIIQKAQDFVTTDLQSSKPSNQINGGICHKTQEVVVAEQPSDQFKDDIIHKTQQIISAELQSSKSSDQFYISSNVDDSVDGGAKVKIVGMEMTASCEGGQRWSRPGTPVLAGPSSRSATPVSPPTPEPQSIFLEGSLPAQSKLIVTDSETQAIPAEDSSETDPPVVLSGKMTLSLISLDSAEDERHRQKEKVQELSTTLKDGAAAVHLHHEYKEEKMGDMEMENEEEEEEEEEEEKRKSNNTQTHSDKTQTSANYTTASAAAEATDATGHEETAADVSAIDLSLPDDQEEEDNLGDEEEVWNGDVDSEEEEEEIQAIPQNPQPQHQR